MTLLVVSRVCVRADQYRLCNYLIIIQLHTSFFFISTNIIWAGEFMQILIYVHAKQLVVVYMSNFKMQLMCENCNTAFEWCL